MARKLQTFAFSIYSVLAMSPIYVDHVEARDVETAQATAQLVCAAFGPMHYVEWVRPFEGRVRDTQKGNTDARVA